MSIDMNRVGLLLHVITEAIQHGAAYRDIVAEANFELQKMNEVARQDGTKRMQAQAEAVAKEKADMQAHEDELAAVPPSGDGVPGPDATMTTANGRRL